MVKLIKTYFFPFIVLFVVFFDELFNCALIVLGIEVDNGIKQYEAVLLALMVYSFLIKDAAKGKVSMRDRKVIAFLFFIVGLYSITPLFYGESSTMHTTYLLVLGSECIPAAYVGIRLAKNTSLHRVGDLLPFFVLPISLLVGVVGIRSAMMGFMVAAGGDEGDGSGLNYQSVSYYMAFCYTYSCYYAFFHNNNPGIIQRLIRVLMTINVFFCAIICLVSGGRGAFVYIIAISLFLMFFFLRAYKKNKPRVVLLLTIIASVFLFLASYFNIMQSAGMGRVLEHIGEDNTRIEMYNKAFDSFLSSPLFGNGVGSIWWTVGFFCHNIFLDLLSETGIIGTWFFTAIILGSFHKLYVKSKSDKIFLLFFMFLSGDFFYSLFSGYWAAYLKIFFVISFVYCKFQNNINYKNVKV